MTIDEFINLVGSNLRKGWIAMDFDGGWYWFGTKPEWNKEEFWGSPDLNYFNLCMFNIDPDPNPAGSLRIIK